MVREPVTRRRRTGSCPRWELPWSGEVTIPKRIPRRRRPAGPDRRDRLLRRRAWPRWSPWPRCSWAPTPLPTIAYVVCMLMGVGFLVAGGGRAAVGRRRSAGRQVARRDRGSARVRPSARSAQPGGELRQVRQHDVGARRAQLRRVARPGGHRDGQRARRTRAAYVTDVVADVDRRAVLAQRLAPWPPPTASRSPRPRSMPRCARCSLAFGSCLAVTTIARPPSARTAATASRAPGIAGVGAMACVG